MDPAATPQHDMSSRAERHADTALSTLSPEYKKEERKKELNSRPDIDLWELRCAIRSADAGEHCVSSFPLRMYTPPSPATAPHKWTTEDESRKSVVDQYGEEEGRKEGRGENTYLSGGGGGGVEA